MYRKIHPPRPSRFPLCGDFAPLGPRDCPRASPSGNLSGLGGCIFRYIPPLGSVRIQYNRCQLYNTEVENEHFHLKQCCVLLHLAACAIVQLHVHWHMKCIIRQQSVVRCKMQMLCFTKLNFLFQMQSSYWSVMSCFDKHKYQYWRILMTNIFSSGRLLRPFLGKHIFMGASCNSE